MAFYGGDYYYKFVPRLVDVLKASNGSSNYLIFKQSPLKLISILIYDVVVFVVVVVVVVVVV